MDQPYCTTEQYTARYGAVADLDQLEECLWDSSRLLAAELGRRNVDPDALDEGLLMQACRQMANRVMPSGGPATAIPSGVTQVGMTGGPYTRQYTFSTPYGSPKVTQAELSLLGVFAGRAGWAALTGDDDG